MDAKTKSQLEQAKAYCYDWRLQEAYGIFRRFFDRLPFRPEPEHADYIGMFTRILLELGKEFELKFYMNELERLHDRSWNASVAYQLGMVYTQISEPRLKASKELFDKIVADKGAADLHAKAKVMLIVHYFRARDYLACRKIIDGIPLEQPDVHLGRAIRIWHCYICCEEKRYDKADEWIKGVLADCDAASDWYSYFSARIGEARLALALEDIERVSLIVDDVRARFEKKRCHSIMRQVESLEKEIAERDDFDTIHFYPGDDEYSVVYKDRTMVIKGDTAAEKLFLLLLKKRFVNKESITKKIYARGYEAERDDKLIYYQIYSLRKRLEAIGLSGDAILSKANGYRLVPRVETVGDHP